MIARLRPVGAWIVLLAAVAVLLRGRFAAGLAQHDQGARAAYGLSFFLLSLLLIATYYAGRALTANRTIPRVACGVELLAYASPNSWLGLERFRHVDVLSPWNDPAMRAYNHVDWFPGAFASYGFLRDLVLLAVAYVLVAWIVFVVWKRRGGGDLRRLRLGLAVLGALYLQTALHTGFRSPYTYLAYFQPNQAPGTWYHLFELPRHGHGVIEADGYWFLLLDNLFKGAPFQQTSNIFMRPFVHFAVSPFTYFADAYDVFLIVNPLLWFVAVACTYDVVWRVCGSVHVARYAAALVACANGFIYYVAQPMSYLAYYTSVVVLIFAFERLLVDDDANALRAPLGRAALFGLILGLASLTYDLFPMYPMLLLYAVFRHTPLRRAVLGCALGVLTYAAYQTVYLKVLGLPVSSVHEEIIAGSAASILQLFGRHSIGELELRTAGMMANYVQNLALGFAIIAFALAVLGLLSNATRAKLFVLVMLVPSLVLNVFFYYGGLKVWGETLFVSLPRFTYIAWLGIYTAAAVALAAASRRVRPGTPAAWLVPWGIIAVIALWNNADVFGLPALTYHFIWPTASPADTYRGGP